MIPRWYEGSARGFFEDSQCRRGFIQELAPRSRGRTPRNFCAILPRVHPITCFDVVVVVVQKWTASSRASRFFAIARICRSGSRERASRDTPSDVCDTVCSRPGRWKRPRALLHCRGLLHVRGRKGLADGARDKEPATLRVDVSCLLCGRVGTPSSLRKALAKPTFPFSQDRGSGDYDHCKQTSGRRCARWRDVLVRLGDRRYGGGIINPSTIQYEAYFGRCAAHAA